MKKQIPLIILLLIVKMTLGQTYDNLHRLDGKNVYYSSNAKERAAKIFDNLAKAEDFFQSEFNIQADYTLLVLSPSDWKIYAHPQAIYGIPHYLPDGRIIVASENNNFWKRNTPPIDKIPYELAMKLKNTYTDTNGEINLTDFFDLLAVHELGHVFQNAAGMLKQRSWLNEIFCNVLLHTYIAEHNPEQLPHLTVFPEVSAKSFPSERLHYTTLEDFETYYNEIATKHPDNYGWYQCRFHVAAGEIYDKGGKTAMKKMWNSVLAQQEKLSNEKLMTLLQTAHPALGEAISNWGK